MSCSRPLIEAGPISRKRSPSKGDRVCALAATGTNEITVRAAIKTLRTLPPRIHHRDHRDHRALLALLQHQLSETEFFSFSWARCRFLAAHEFSPTKHMSKKQKRCPTGTMSF